MCRNQDILQSLINNNDDMIFALDLEKRYVLFNNAHQLSMKKRYGVTIENGRSMLDYVDNENDIGIGNDVFQRVAAGETMTIESEFGNKGFYRGHTELHIFPLKDDGGKIFGISVFARNITKQMALQLQNYHYINMMEHIVSDLSHKLRKPVATILGLIQLIDAEKEFKDLPQILSYLKESTNEQDECIRQMTNLIEQKPTQ